MLQTEGLVGFGPMGKLIRQHAAWRTFTELQQRSAFLYEYS